MDVEGISLGDRSQLHTLEKEEQLANIRKAKKAHLSYLKNTEWMFSNQHFEEPLEHMANYF